MKSLFAVSLAAVALALTASPTSAQEVRQLVVSYADLDLSTDRGVRILDRRLRAAAVEACGPTSDADLAGKNNARDCRLKTLSTARAQRDVAIAGLDSSRRIQIAAWR